MSTTVYQNYAFTLFPIRNPIKQRDDLFILFLNFTPHCRLSELHSLQFKMCKGEGKAVPVLQLNTTPWRRIGERRYSYTHSWPRY